MSAGGCSGADPNEAALEPRPPFPDGRAQLHLVGFMGAGKSTVGRLLARRLLWNFLDLDVLVSRHTGASVAAVFEQQGEAAFREAETHCLRQAVQKPRTVLALGGGAWGSEVNREVSRGRGFGVWLDCSLETIRERLGADDDARPLWDDLPSVRRRYERRRAAYALADLRVDAEAPPETVVQRVLDRLPD